VSRRKKSPDLKKLSQFFCVMRSVGKRNEEEVLPGVAGGGQLEVYVVGCTEKNNETQEGKTLREKKQRGSERSKKDNGISTGSKFMTAPVA